ncbi:MAG: threonylcarbamoyl-AMP synthase [Dehalococcoidia bacterium]|nr:threonylcarbamoyl-AMP synthase [Dehalococcoidia bacterium]MYA54351.1 threonylcarbamoyl-AMP synthase [Dehalococcoidia bacterium]
MAVPAASEPSPESIARTVAALRAGGLAIIATDTVYGVAADIRRDDAVRALYEAKRKSADEPLQLLFPADRDALAPYARLSRDAARLIDALGPGPWTIITPAGEGWSSPALAGGATVGVRMPPVATLQAVLAGLGAPVAASSANRHGDASPTTCAQALDSLGPYCAAAIDDGPTSHGLDSSVIDCSVTPPRILREGALPADTIAGHLGLAGIEVVRRAGVQG